MDLERIMVRIRACMENEDRKDPEFRALLAQTEVGDCIKYITHDPVLNPGARPHGTKTDEMLAYGQAFVMLLACAQLRGIDTQGAVEMGLTNWEEADWRRRIAQEGGSGKLIGIGVVPGYISGEVFVLGHGHPLEDMPADCILVSEFAKPDIIEFLPRVRGLVTDNGGSMCHAAVMALQYNIPSIVGTGNATKVLKHGQVITLEVPRNGHGVEVIVTVQE